MLCIRTARSSACLFHLLIVFLFQSLFVCYNVLLQLTISADNQVFRLRRKFKLNVAEGYSLLTTSSLVSLNETKATPP